MSQGIDRRFDVDLALETEHVGRLNAGIPACRQQGDNGSRVLPENVLEDSELHVDWLEAALELTRQLGEDVYLNAQVHD